MCTIPQIKLNNGLAMPQLGLGVLKMTDGDEVRQAVLSALKEGYRSIDTARAYGNEEGVGQALKESGIPRKEIFLTTKLWNRDQGYDSTLKAFQESLARLGSEYVDLYLIHWPGRNKYKDTWKAMEKLYNDGLIKAIGVSNFQVHHLDDLHSSSDVIPVVNQIELHPYLIQKEVRGYCFSHDIKVEAWSPLGQGLLLQDQTLQRLAKKYQKSVAQIILRWDIQNGIIIIPKTTRPERMKENMTLFDFSIDEADMKTIDSLNKNQRTGPDPDIFF
jgi:diketogulonate reductase-like aldo/keto reductase